MAKVGLHIGGVILPKLSAPSKAHERYRLTTDTDRFAITNI